MISLKNVTVSFGDRTVLDNFSFTFPEKGVVLVTGTSGKGKTTLAKVILGILKPQKGSVDTSSAKITAVFQEDRLIPSFTALQNVQLVSDKVSANNRLDQMKLSKSKALYPSELSGGMKRRVALARALAFSGDVLLLDEAFSGIDDQLAREIIKMICGEYKDKLIIAITHRTELFSEIDYTICEI